MSDFATPRTPRQASISITNSQNLLKLMSIKSVMPSNHLILCRRRLLLPSIFPSIRVFSNESVLHIKGPKDCSFSCSISPFNEYSRLISFRMDSLDLLAVPRDSQESSPTPQFKSTPTVKRLPAMRETRVRFLGRESPLEKEMAVHSSTLAWKILWTEEPDKLQSMGSQRARHD